MEYIIFLVIVFILIGVSLKQRSKFEREKYDAYCKGFLAALDMDDRAAPRSSLSTRDYPNSPSQNRINGYWKHERTTYFDWYSSYLYKNAYREGYRCGKVDTLYGTNDNAL